jgi:hypothetical protein
MVHVLGGNRHCLVVNKQVAQASGTADRAAAACECGQERRPPRAS